MTAEKLLEKISEEYQSVLSDKLVGIYVHGSLAFGCYNPKISDVDLIIVVKEPVTLSEKTLLIGTLMQLEKYAPEKGIEMSVVTENDCRDFVYPTPYQLHYSITYREDYAKDIEGFCKIMNGVDYDLAAHFTVIKSIGYPLCGKEIDEVFGEVPRENYLDSITRDISGAAEEISYNPVYFVLNLCRVLAYVKDGCVLSKKQGGLWGVENCPKVYSFVISQALECYRTAEDFPEDYPLQAFADYMLSEIQKGDTGGKYV